MTYAQTALLGLYNIDHLSEENTWDDLIDTNFTRLEQAIHGAAGITLSGIDVTLDDTPYTGTQSHRKLLIFVGEMAASCNVIVPSKLRLYHVLNATTGAGGNAYTATVKTAAGTGVALVHGEYAILRGDGASVYSLYRSSQVLGVGGGTLTGTLNANSNRITNLPWPASINNDAASVSWVDNLINAAIVNVRNALYPVGSLYFNAANATNPGTLLGFGTWVAYGGGTYLMAAGTHTDARGEFRNYSGAYEKAPGGEYQHVLTTAEIPSHDHPIDMSYGAGGGGNDVGAYNSAGPRRSGAAGGGGAHNNMPPFSVVYVWRRTA